jgi:hypothetical protein
MKNLPLMLATLVLAWMSLVGYERFLLVFLGGLVLFVMMVVTCILTLIWKKAGRGGYRPRDGVVGSACVLLCFSIILTSWPLCLAFVCVRPAMEQIAQQVLLDKSVSLPRRVGPFTVKAVTFNGPGQAWLWTDNRGIGAGAFVLAPDSEVHGNLNEEIAIDSRWHYITED